jgi:hypothetical protein
VSIDWSQVPELKISEGNVIIEADKQLFTIAVKAIRNRPSEIKGFSGFIEGDGYISIYAKNYQHISNTTRYYWSKITGLGRTEEAVESLPISVMNALDKNTSPTSIRKMPSVTYDFYSTTPACAEIKIFTIPTYPLNTNFEMRYAVSIDGGPLNVLNFKTFGRSEEWKQAVLSNTIARSVSIPHLNAGKHSLQVFMIDPGVILDRIVIDLGGLQPFYGLLPESKIIVGK